MTNNDINYSKIASWEYAKNNLQLCLQRRTSEEILKKSYLDMELYVRVKVSNNSAYKVKPGMFPEVSTDEIFARALLQAKDDIVAENMVQMIAGMMG